MGKEKINMLSVLAVLLTSLRWVKVHNSLISKVFGGLCVVSTATVVSTSAIINTPKAQEHFETLACSSYPNETVPYTDTIIKESPNTKLITRDSIVYVPKLVRVKLDTTLIFDRDTFTLFADNNSLRIEYKITSGVVADSGYIYDKHTASILIPFKYTNKHLIDAKDNILRLKYNTFVNEQSQRINVR